MVFYKTRCDEVDSTSLAPPASVKMNSRTPNEDAEQLFYRAPIDSYFTNFTSSFIRTQTLPEVTSKDNIKNLINK